MKRRIETLDGLCTDTQIESEIVGEIMGEVMSEEVAVVKIQAVQRGRQVRMRKNTRASDRSPSAVRSDAGADDM